MVFVGESRPVSAITRKSFFMKKALPLAVTPVPSADSSEPERVIEAPVASTSHGSTVTESGTAPAVKKPHTAKNPIPRLTLAAAASVKEFDEIFAKSANNFHSATDKTVGELDWHGISRQSISVQADFGDSVDTATMIDPVYASGIPHVFIGNEICRVP